MSSLLTDDAARQRIATDTASTLFVEAGAGSGKTTELVHRVATLVIEDAIPLSAIAAVTFTEKAGAELRDRLRARFEDAWRHRAEGDQARDRAEAALDDLDAAAIGTLHSFAQRILSEHPIEAGLPPVIEVLDEVGSSVAFDERWAGMQTDLLDDDDVADALLLGLAAGVDLKHLRSIARLLGADWDLIGDRVHAEQVDGVSMPDVTQLIAAAADLATAAQECTDPDDKLLAKARQLEQFGILLDAAPDHETRLGLLRTVNGLKFTVGRKENWPDVNRVRDDCTALVAHASAAVDAVIDTCLRSLTCWIGMRVLVAADARRAEGRLEFHDLLVLARDLLRRNPMVRATLHERYQRLLLDEFQDTDPIQIELAVRIAGGESASGHWQEVDVPEGRIFVVGDPKQSIYRFRRASIATYFDARAHLGYRVDLTTNFRTVPPVLRWVNDVFGRLIEQSEAQPAYQQLDRHRVDIGDGSGPAVTVLGATAHAGLPRAQAEILRRREAADVAAVARRALAERWQVWDNRTDRPRAAAPDDIAILVPARTSLPFLEDALDAAGVAYRAEASSLVYQAGEIRDLLACARSIADPSDALSLVTALRSPVFGCGDDDLWRWKQAGGVFSIFSRFDPDAAGAAPEITSGPVAAALDYLRHLHNRARWMTPSEALGAIIADRRMSEVGATGPRARDTWRRLRFVVDQARAWSEVSGGGLRAYLAWAAHQGQEASRVAEAVLPEADAHAVKVMTVHAAKGLEFPIVILSGMTSEPQNQRGVQVLWPAPGGYEVKLSKSVQTGDFDVVQPLDEQMDRLERRRLLYVAATRARDHLVVSLHRAEGSTRQTNAKLLFDAGAATAAGAEAFSAWEQSDDSTPAARRLLADPPASHEEWNGRIERARTATRRAAAISASGLEGTEPDVVLAGSNGDASDVGGDADQRAGRAKGARDLELPPWSKGRYGSAIGRAVHGVLQSIDLGDGSGLDAAARAQAIAEGVTDYAEIVTGLVRSAIGAEIVRRAAERQHWREAYVGTVHDETVHEGIVDLLFRDDDGTLVVVDYKTDAIPASAINQRSIFYAPQIRSYVAMLAEATDLEVRGLLLFLNPHGPAVSVTIDEVDASPPDQQPG